MSVLVGRKAPDFTASAVLADGSIVDDFTLSKTLEGKYGMVVFYPLDFTFVCPSELIALDHRVPAFEERNVQLIGVSIDSAFTHARWRRTALDDGGIGEVRYPLVADISHEISKAYDVESSGGGPALRGAFLIDKDGIVQAQVVHADPIGRNADELVRIVDALQFSEEHGQVCPAGWNKGDQGMKADADGVASYLASNHEKL